MARLSLIISTESMHPPLFWYNSSSNNDGISCKLLRLEEYICILMLRIRGLIR